MEQILSEMCKFAEFSKLKNTCRREALFDSDVAGL